MQDTFGGTDVLELRDVPERHAGSGQVRVRVTAAGLNPVDWKIAGNAEIEQRYGLTLPAGFGNDFAGTIDEIGAEVGEGVEGWSVGDRVYGGARGHAVAEQIVIDLARDILRHTPDGVGVYAVQLARRRGARMLGTASASGAETVREFGGEPVEYGDGLVDRVRALATTGSTPRSTWPAPRPSAPRSSSGSPAPGSRPSPPTRRSRGPRRPGRPRHPHQRSTISRPPSPRGRSGCRSSGSR